MTRERFVAILKEEGIEMTIALDAWERRSRKLKLRAKSVRAGAMVFVSKMSMLDPLREIVLHQLAPGALKSVHLPKYSPNRNKLN